jgi:hypothetical protein
VYRVCSAETISEKCVKIGKVLKGPRGEGDLDEELIKKRIISYIEERHLKFPIVIYDYWSKHPSSKTGLDLIADGRGPRFQPRKPRPNSKSYRWLVDEKKRIFDLSNFKILHEEECAHHNIVAVKPE